MKTTIASIFIIGLFSVSSHASDVKSCTDLAGKWKTIAGNNEVTMTIVPTSKSCGKNCSVMKVDYNLGDMRTNELYCHEGLEGVKGQGPMVIAFEGAYGGHSVGTYNRQMKTLWAGVIHKDHEKWEMQMEDYWFKRAD